MKEDNLKKIIGYSVLGGIAVLIIYTIFGTATPVETIQEPDLSNQTLRYRKDWAGIRKTYMEYVESIRLKGRLKEGHEVNCDSIKPELLSGFFIFTPYAYRFNERENRYVASPFKTETQINVSVDTIVYNKDSLQCVALVIIDNHPSKYPDLRSEKDSIWFDGQAIIGYRFDKDDDFYLFPIVFWSMVGNSTYSITKQDLRNFYFKRIKGTRSWDGEYTCGIGDPAFFTTAPDFKKDSLGNYLFEISQDLNRTNSPYYNYELKVNANEDRQ